MGLWDLIIGLPEIIKEAQDDWRENVAPAFEEVKEALTDGFVEMVIKDNNSYQTSYQKIETANAIVNSAKSRYDKNFYKVKKYFDETDELVKNHHKLKQSLQDTVLNKSIMKELEIDLHPGISKRSSTTLLSNIGTSLVVTGFSSIGGLNPTSITIAQWVNEKNKRVEDANIYLENSKVYEAKINIEVKKLKSLRSRMKLIRYKINEEAGLLSRLTEKLELIANYQSTILSKEHILAEEKEKFNVLTLIAKAINETITTKFFTDSGDITSEYEKVLENLKHVENMIIERGVM